LNDRLQKLMTFVTTLVNSKNISWLKWFTFCFVIIELVIVRVCNSDVHTMFTACPSGLHYVHKKLVIYQDWANIIIYIVPILCKYLYSRTRKITCFSFYVCRTNITIHIGTLIGVFKKLWLLINTFMLYLYY